MKKWLVYTGVLLISYGGLSGSAVGQTSRFPGIGKIVRESPQLDQLIAPDARIELLDTGFIWTEGPVWVKDSSYLLFTDIPRNAVMKWQEGKGTRVFLKPAGYTGVVPYGNEPGSNGLVLDARGQLVSCEHGDRRISVLLKDGGKRTWADNYGGKRFNSPNDAVLKSNGDLYFTDPPYGLPGQWDDPRRELHFCGVYRLTPAGKVTLLTGEMTRPNGIAFSPDEKTLYVAQSDPQHALWKAFPVLADGMLGKSRIFYEVTATVTRGDLPGLPDGMKVDRNGNIFATGPGGVYIFSPEGKLLGRLDTGQPTTNCAWGDDGSTLYITANHYLCRIRTRTRGW